MLIVLCSFSFTAAAIMALRPTARNLGLLDHPGGRKTHKKPTPMVGGLGIYVGLLLTALVFGGALVPEHRLLLGVSALMLIVGTLDDRHEIRVRNRLLMQILAALLMVYVADVRIDSLGDIAFNGSIPLNLLAVPFTLFATVGVINAVNMSDGLDGLAGGLVTICLLCLVAATAITGHSADLIFKQMLIAALLAFLILNFRFLNRKSALVYMGDGGSTLLGFITAWLLISATQGPDAIIAPTTALWFLAIPLIDTLGLLIRRPMRGRSPLKPGRDHLHHHLLARGYSPRRAVLIIHFTAIILGLIGLAGELFLIHEGIMFLGILSVFLLYLFMTPAGDEEDVQASAI